MVPSSTSDNYFWLLLCWNFECVEWDLWTTNEKQNKNEYVQNMREIKATTKELINTTTNEYNTYIANKLQYLWKLRTRQNWSRKRELPRQTNCPQIYWQQNNNEICSPNNLCGRWRKNKRSWCSSTEEQLNILDSVNCERTTISENYLQDTYSTGVENENCQDILFANLLTAVNAWSSMDLLTYNSIPDQTKSTPVW